MTTFFHSDVARMQTQRNECLFLDYILSHFVDVACTNCYEMAKFENSIVIICMYNLLCYLCPHLQMEVTFCIEGGTEMSVAFYTKMDAA